jgi:hypothetical protein
VKQGLASAREARKKKRLMNILVIEDDREEMTLLQEALSNSTDTTILVEHADRSEHRRPCHSECRRIMHLYEFDLEDSSYNQILIRSYLKQTPYHLDIAEHGGHRVGRFKSSNYGDGLQ